MKGFFIKINSRTIQSSANSKDYLNDTFQYWQTR